MGAGRGGERPPGPRNRVPARRRRWACGGPWPGPGAGVRPARVLPEKSGILTQERPAQFQGCAELFLIFFVPPPPGQSLRNSVGKAEAGEVPFGPLSVFSESEGVGRGAGVGEPGGTRPAEACGAREGRPGGSPAGRGCCPRRARPSGRRGPQKPGPRSSEGLSGVRPGAPTSRPRRPGAPRPGQPWLLGEARRPRPAGGRAAAAPPRDSWGPSPDFTRRRPERGAFPRTWRPSLRLPRRLFRVAGGEEEKH